MDATTTAISGLGFPEALRWHDGELWFSDMFRGRVVRWRPGTAPEVVLDAAGGGPVVPGGLGWLPGGDLLVVDCLERRVLRLALGPGRAPVSPTVHADLRAELRHPANDMHVDADGTAWVGGYGFDPDADDPAGSRLVRITLDGAFAAWGDELVFPNGCERSADGTLIVAETFADRVSGMDAAGSRTTIADLAAGCGPDGLSIASDGSVYVALAFVGEVVRLDGDGHRSVYRPSPLVGGEGAGPLGCYDCAVSPDGAWLAVATASADEALAERVDTGSITLVPLVGG